MKILKILSIFFGLAFAIVAVEPVQATVFDCVAGDVNCLIDSINTANINGEDDTVNLEESTYLLVAVDNETDGPNGLPTITTNITINGNGSTIERGSDSKFRIFHVAAEGNLTLKNLTVKNGDPSGQPNGASNGFDGGGIYNVGTSTLANCTLSDNIAGEPGCWYGNGDYYSAYCGQAGGGGAIYNHENGTVVVTNSTFINNRAGDGGSVASGSAGGAGGGIYNNGNMTLTECMLTNNSGGGGGNGTWFDHSSGGRGGDGGGIYNNGIVTLTECVLTNNSGGKSGRGTWGDGRGGDGGGIYNNGDITLTECMLNSNSAGEQGWQPSSGSGGNGGGIYNTGTSTFTNCFLSGNNGGDCPYCDIEPWYEGHHVGNGGGIYNSGTLILTNSTLSDNSAGICNREEDNDCNGGAIYNSGTGTLTNCTVNGNTADLGGGIYNISAVTLTNSIVANNSVGNCASADLGPIQNPDNDHCYQRVSTYMTWHNAKSHCENLGGYLVTTTSQEENQFINNIFLHGSVSFLGGFQPPGSPEPDGNWQWVTGEAWDYTNWYRGEPSGGRDEDYLSTWWGGYWVDFTPDSESYIICEWDVCDNNLATDNILSLGHNLFSDETCTHIASDIIADPLLGPLADNGGPTETHALLPGSPAIDAGDKENYPETDQRGVARPHDGDGDGEAICDIGAYEFEPPDTIPPTCRAHLTEPVDPYDLRGVIEIQDTGSGLKSIEEITLRNADLTIPSFDEGTTDQVDVVADGYSGWSVRVKATDVAGNYRTCDPVITLKVRKKGKPENETFSDIPKADHYVDVYNGDPGVKHLDIIVNGEKLKVRGLGDNEEETLDVASAMVEGDKNVFQLIAKGKPGGSVTVVIHDGTFQF